MDQKQQNDLPPADGNERPQVSEEPPDGPMDRIADGDAALPLEELRDPQRSASSPAGARGRGEVRSDHDRRLQDNLTPQQRSEIGRKGGESVSRNRAHMAAIGRKGGQRVSQNREHMAAIGRQGGRA